ncbi:MAG: hypothetical protein J6V50_06455, partial [Clostridia bacterium]|nr:hypothetical protein [Clostridia bacterium]
MKKILAFVCAIAVFVSSLSGALVFTLADPVGSGAVTDTVTLPAILDSEGKTVSLYPDTDLTGLGVVGSDKIDVVKNPTDLPLTGLYAASATEVVNFAPVEAEGHKGIIMYVETPDIGSVTHTYDNQNKFTTDQFRFALHFTGYDKTNPATYRDVFSYMYGGDWYSMVEGSSEWTAQAREYYGIQLEYGFKGYVYVPFATFTDSGRTITDDFVITSVTIRQLKNTTDVFYDENTNKSYSGYVTEENPVVYSIPMFVKDDGTTDKPSTKSIVVGEKEYFLNKIDTPYNYAELDVTTALTSYVGTADGSAASNGLRTLKGGMSALTTNAGTYIKQHRVYNDNINAETAAGRGYFATGVAYDDIGAGFMVHVDIPKLDGNQTVSITLYDTENGVTKNIDTNVGKYAWYVLPDGATAWQEKGQSDWETNNRAIVGDGSEPFSGYVYFPKNLIYNGTQLKSISEVRVGVHPRRHSNKAPNTQDVNISVSAVSFISKFKENSTLAYADTGALVDLATGEVVRTDYEAAKPFYGYATVNDTKTYLTAKAATLKAQALYQLPAAAGTHVSASAEYVPSITPISDVAAMKFTGKLGSSRTHITNYDVIEQAVGDTTGVLMYIETKGQLSLGFMYGVKIGGAAATYPQYGYARSFYYLADGASAWATTTAATPVNGVSQLPANFKGYIYVPYSATLAATDVIFRFGIYAAAVAADTDYELSLGNPMLANFTEENAGLIKYNGATETQNMFSGEYFVPTDAETAAPDVVYDYSAYDIMNIGVTELNGAVSVGTALPNTALTSGPTAGATLEAVKSRLAVSDYPSFKISTGALTTVNYQFNLNEATATGGKHVMTYIELPEGKSAKLKTGWNVHKNGAAGYGSQYGGQVYILQDGDTAWTALSVSAYLYELPEGFKGYVRYNLASLNLGGALAGTTVDETYSIYQSNYTFSDFEAGIDIYVSAPIMVDEITAETDPVNVAFVNGNTAIAKNIFTGDYFYPVEADNSNTSSEEASSEVSSEVSSEEVSSDDVTSDTSSEEENDFVAPSGITSIVNPTGAITIVNNTAATLVTQIDSLSPAAVNKSVKVEGVTGGTITQYDFYNNTETAKGIIFYIKTEQANPEIAIQSFGTVDGDNAYPNTSNRYGRMYYMAVGDTSWKTTPTAEDSQYTKNYRQLDAPNGFEGYIYLPFSGSAATVTSDAVLLKYARVCIVANAADKPLYQSSPLLVKDFYADSAYATVDNKKCINLFDGTDYVPDATSSEESSSEDTSSDTSSDDTPTRPTVEPDYDLPKYTGAALDYTGYNISKIWVARLNEKVFVGYPFAHPTDKSKVEGGDYEVINSIVPITNYPSMKVTATGTTATVMHYVDASKTKGATAALYYVEVPAGKEASVSFRVNAHKEGGGNAYGNNNSKPIYILAEGSDEWTPISSSAYFAKLPAGFKGYIRQDYKDLAQIKDQDDISSVSAYYISLIVSGIAAGDEFKISAPMLMDNVSSVHVATVAFVEGDTAARNVFTSDFVLPGDEELGEIIIPKPDEEPDYNLPYYVGTAPDYSKYTISKAWVARLNEEVFIGYPLSGTASDNSSFVGDYEFVESITPITKYPAIKLTSKNSANPISAAIYTNEAITSGANSAMYYVELPEGKNAAIRIALNFKSEKTPSKRIYGVNYSRKVFILAEGTTEWVEVKTDAYYSQLPAGFKGYVRQDYADISASYTQGEGEDKKTITVNPDEEDTLYGANVYFKDVAENDSVKVTLPILLNKYYIEATCETAVFVNEDTAARNLFSGNHVMPGDASLGVPRKPKPEVEPEYDLPYYDGAKPDYTNYNFSNYWVAKLNDKVFVGYALPEKAAYASGADLFAIDSITPITNYPSIRVTATAGTASLSFNPKAASASGANAALFYIEAPADKEITVSYRLNFSKKGEKNIYGNHYNKPIYVLTEGNKNWKSIPCTNSYNATLPAGFKGYIRADYSKLSVNADETWTLYYEGLIISGLEKGDVVNVSAPILADAVTSDRLPNGAYIEGDPKAPRELFTGKFLLPGDKDLGGPTVEPDYKVPAYTGAAIDYGKIDIMNVKTAKLNGTIIVGRELSEDVYKISTGKGEATKSLSGVSNYPMLKLTGMDIPVGERVTVATGNYDWQANLGAKSVMFYVKIPEGQDTNFAISWSWHHEDGRTTGAYNYNGTAYLMAKDQVKWKSVDISKYWIDLPAGYEGYIRFDLKDIWCVYPYDENGHVIYELDENGNKIWNDPENKGKGYKIDSDADHKSLKDDKWGLQTTYIQLSNEVQGKKSDAIISSPILIDEFIPLQTIQNIAYVDGDTKAARNIFTGAVVKLGDFDATAGAEPNYDIPFHNGKAENYDKLAIMKTRTGRLNYAVLIGEEFSPTALAVGAGTAAMPVKSIYPLTNYPSIEMKNLGTGDVNVTMKTDPEANAGATHIM